MHALAGSANPYAIDARAMRRLVEGHARHCAAEPGGADPSALARAPSLAGRCRRTEDDVRVVAASEAARLARIPVTGSSNETRRQSVQPHRVTHRLRGLPGPLVEGAVEGV